MVAGVAITAAAPTAGAAYPMPSPQIVDPSGDSAGGQAAHDVLSVRYATTGPGTGRRYVPKKLVVTLTLAAAPVARDLVSYNLRASTDACGDVRMQFMPGTVSGMLTGDAYADFNRCTPERGRFFWAKVKGNVVTFDFLLESIGVERGTRFSAFTATVDVTEPVMGVWGTEAPGTAGLIDSAAGDVTWVVP